MGSEITRQAREEPAQVKGIALVRQKIDDGVSAAVAVAERESVGSLPAGEMIVAGTAGEVVARGTATEVIRAVATLNDLGRRLAIARLVFMGGEIRRRACELKADGVGGEIPWDGTAFGGLQIAPEPPDFGTGNALRDATVLGQGATLRGRQAVERRS